MAGLFIVKEGDQVRRRTRSNEQAETGQCGRQQWQCSGHGDRGRRYRVPREAGRGEQVGLVLPEDFELERLAAGQVRIGREAETEIAECMVSIDCKAVRATDGTDERVDRLEGDPCGRVEIEGQQVVETRN
ncbi:hypothetical protein [Meridianimarinicoccus roseus]|uniref:hypothetical protein n=1 Tax=Meridianimarinicoccus roseus TaxID=2072018 RepID=UPI0011B26CE5|nr:hypothetical protein [Meridianimarinicoccus roseus]